MPTPDVPICLLVGDRNDQSALESLLEPMTGRLQVCDRLDDALQVLAEQPGLLIASGMALPPGGLSRLEQLDSPPAVLLLSGEEGPLLQRQGALDALSGSVPPSVTVLQRPLRPATAETLVRQLSRLVAREPSGPRPVPETPAEETPTEEGAEPDPLSSEASKKSEAAKTEADREKADARAEPAGRKSAEPVDEPATTEPAPDPLEERLDEMGIGTMVRSRPHGPIRLSSEVQRLTGLPATTSTLVPLLLRVRRDEQPRLIRQIRAAAGPDREDPAAESQAESETEATALDVTVRIRSDGSTQWVRVRGRSAGTAPREEPAETGWTVLVEDVTAQRRREQQRNDRIEHLRSQVARHSQRVRRIAERLTDAEEEERSRIASVLHDDLQPLIYGAFTQINEWKERLDSGEVSAEPFSESVSAEEEGDGLSVSKRLNQMATQLRQAMSLMRSLVSRIRPPVLHTSTFAETLEWLSVHVEETLGAELDVDVPEGFDVTGRGRRAFLFDAIRETVFNAVRHGEVHTVKVCGRQSEARSHVVVEDTGAGFDPSTLEQQDQGQGGFGLSRIQQRLEDLGGELKIDSAPGIGTRITMILPRRTEGAEENPAARPSSVES